MPEFDMLQFDYTSGRRPGKDAAVFSRDTFVTLLKTLQNSDTSPACQSQAMRMSSHMVYLTSLQMREVMGLYRRADDRAEFFVLCFNRIIDMHNEKVFRVRFESREVIRLRERLGPAVYFPFMQPEQSQFQFDFSCHDQRLACNVLLNLSCKESRQNLRDAVHVSANGTVLPLDYGIPKSWDSWERMPKDGSFSVLYVCGPEDRKFLERKKYLDVFGNCPTDVKEEEVMWWGNIAEAPEDLLEYLEFLTSHYTDLKEPFLVIDGADGNGQITRREFTEGYHKMGCTKFKGKDEAARLEVIFRYLDPTGEGQISEMEWGALTQFWKEVQLSIKEFVQFCERTFGDDLEIAWEYLDDDQSGEITLEEWEEAVISIGYFGPAKPIFGYLDKDDEGTLSLEEFALLHQFQTKQTRKTMMWAEEVTRAKSEGMSRQRSEGM